MIRKDVSVRETLRVIILVTTVSALLLAGVAFAGSDLYGFRHSLQIDLITLADVVASESAAEVMLHDQQSALHTLEALRARPSIVAVGLYDADGKAFVSRYSNGNALRPPSKAPVPFSSITFRSIEVARPIVYRGERVGTLYVASDLREFFAHLKIDAVVGVLILIAALLLAIAVSLVLERVLTDPILQLSAVADRVRCEKDYALRTPIDPRSPREIAALRSAFNDMLAEIETRDEELRSHREDLRIQVDERTEELRATAELNESLSHHKQAILDAAGEGIFGLDSNGIATFINASAARLLGYSVRALIGRRLHDVVHTPEGRSVDYRECSVCSAGPAIRTERTDVFVGRDGRTFPIEYTSSAMAEHQSSGIVVTFRDITERLAVERMKDEFVSTVSHELRTPLTSIRGALGLLSGGLLGTISERGQRMLDIAVTSTDRLVRLINDILDLERISSGTVQLNRKVISAAALMRDAADVVQTVADRASVAICVEPDPTLLWVDPDRIVQTLTNLAGNAVKFSPPGSTVRISGKLDERQHAFVFSIADDGRGIPDDKVKTIFERFQQVDASDSRDKGGSGLGLAICRSIVAAHNGSIWVQSTLGEGSVFRFTVPLAIAASDIRPRTNTGTTVLVCDEDAAAIAGMIEANGMRALVVNDSSSLAAQARSASAIVVGSSSGKGSAMIAELRASPYARILPIILISEQPPPAVEAEGDPAVAWIQKPANEEDLMDALRLTSRNTKLRPVLIVEDDLDLARVMAMFLESHNFRTVGASTGAEAIAACERFSPAALILDVGLPEGDGFSVAEWMRGEPALCDTPLLVYSAADLTSSDQDRLRLGRTIFLTKSRASFPELEKCVLSLIQDSVEVEGAA